MTLQQLRYITTVADTGTITEAAKKLYISQPSLTNAIHELEKEMGITIFNRTNKGIFISREGEEFLGYARQVLQKRKDQIENQIVEICPELIQKISAEKTLFSDRVLSCHIPVPPSHK